MKVFLSWSGKMSRAAHGYWIELDREAAIGLVGRFRKFVERQAAH